jgi:tetratricopeptide (TPR) repeat protein
MQPAIAPEASGNPVSQKLRDALSLGARTTLLVASTTPNTPDTQIWIADGLVVGASAAPVAEESLGRILFESGMLSSEAYASALDRLADSDPDVRLGEILVQANLCTQTKVDRGLAKQVELRVLRAMADENALVRTSDQGPTDGSFRVKLAWEQLCFASAERLRDAELEAYLATARQLYPVAHGARSGQYLRNSGADPARLAFILQLNGSMTCDEVCEGHAELERFLVGLMLHGCVNLRDRRQAENTPHLTDDEISGLRRAASLDLEDDARGSAGEIQAVAAADSQNDLSKNTVARVKLNRVTLSLRKVPERSPRDPRDARILAEIHFLNALTLARIGNWERALQSSKQALANLPSGKGYAIADARYRWKMDRAHEAQLLAELQNHQSASWNSQAMFILGELDAEHGLWDSAYEFVESSLRWYPKNSEASQKLKTLEKRRSRPDLRQPRVEPAEPIAHVDQETATSVVQGDSPDAGVHTQQKLPSIKPATKVVAPDVTAPSVAITNADTVWLLWTAAIAVGALLGYWLGGR